MSANTSSSECIKCQIYQAVRKILLLIPVAITVLAAWYLFSGEAARQSEAAQNLGELAYTAIWGWSALIWLGIVVVAVAMTIGEEIASLGLRWRAACEDVTESAE